MKLVLRKALDLPAELPHAEERIERLGLELLTHGRILVGVDADALDLRAHRLLHYLKMKSLQGSQYGRKSYPYYVEVVSHELAHARLLGVAWSTKMLDQVIFNEMREMPKEQADINELQAAASTMLVLEYLGLPYDIWALALSTSQNLRGASSLRLARETYPFIMRWRQVPKIQEVARQIVCRLLKLKYEEVRDFEHL